MEFVVGLVPSALLRMMMCDRVKPELAERTKKKKNKKKRNKIG